MNHSQTAPAIAGIAAAAALLSCSGGAKVSPSSPPVVAEANSDGLIFAGEKHFESVRQLTFGGENAEAYFSGDGTELIFQSTRDQFECDQMFRMDSDGQNVRLVSTGTGRTTCGFIFPDQPKILFSSSHAASPTCPPKPDYSRGYVWPLLADLDIYVAGPNGENPTPLAPHAGYDAEAVVSAQGDGVIFTSTRGGDIDIWHMKPDGTEIKQLTHELGYDGGAFFSPDGKQIVYRANHPTTQSATKDYQSLLAEGFVRPSVMNLMVMNRDGGDKRVVLANGAANFAPYFHPDGKRIIFASNMDSEGGRDFDLYMIGVDGTGLERVTFSPSFDAFPMFSHDGSRLVFASNRNGSREGETNVFVAQWRDDVPPGPEAELTGAAAIDPQTWHEAATRLAAPELAGRGLGTAELEQAAEIIARRFGEVGLEAAGDGATFFQAFDAAVASEVELAKLVVGDQALGLNEEFRPFPFSGSGDVSAEAVFVGWGITSPRHGYDDYAGVDVDGKVAVAFRYEPRRAEKDAKFDGTDPTPESDLRFKALNARHRGAVALIIVNPPPAGDETDVLHAFAGAPSQVGIPTAHVSWAAAARVFGEEVLQRHHKALEVTHAPSTGPLGRDVKLSLRVKRQLQKVRNVVGRLGAADARRAIVLGAHYDHLGHGGEASLAPGQEVVHPGADDNASGVAMLFELAEAFTAVPPSEVALYFVAFTGEESGLLGSSWFVEQWPKEGPQVEAMLNFDMVGRAKQGRVNVFGTGTAKGLLDVVRRAQVGLDLTLSVSPGGYGPSDHMPFTVGEVPVLHFFTGAHPDYHRPSDTAEKLNAEGAALVGTLAYRVARELVDSSAGLEWVAVRSARAGDSGGDGRRGYGPYFGSIPAFGDDAAKGAKVSGATPGSPAAVAGLLPGDVIVKFGEFEVANLRDFAFALRQHTVGQIIDVVVVRDGKEVILTATLTAKTSGGSKSPHGHGPSGGAESRPHGAPDSEK